MTKLATFHGLEIVRQTKRTLVLRRPAKGLARIRHELGMTTYALSSVLDINRSTWSECENGHRRLTKNQLVNLSAYLHKIGHGELMREINNTSGDGREWSASGMNVTSTTLLGLVADIRAAVGDPTGKLMQDELVEHCRKLAHSEDWNRRRVEMLSRLQKHMREPERTLVCDIIASAQLLPDPKSERYGFAATGNEHHYKPNKGMVPTSLPRRGTAPVLGSEVKP